MNNYSLTMLWTPQMGMYVGIEIVTSGAYYKDIA